MQRESGSVHVFEHTISGELSVLAETWTRPRTLQFLRTARHLTRGIPRGENNRPVIRATDFFARSVS